MQVSEVKAFRIKRMQEHLVVIMEGSKKKQKVKSDVLQILDFSRTQHTNSVQNCSICKPLTIVAR